MKTRLLLPVVCLVLTVGAFDPALKPDTGAGSSKAVSIRLDGELLKTKSPPLLIDSIVYVPLNEFCKAMGSAFVQREDGLAAAISPGLLISAAAGDCYIIANSRYLYAHGQCMMAGNTLYVPLPPLAKAYGNVLIWSALTSTAYLIPKYGPVEDGGTFYDETDLYWMSRIINAEARGECMPGKIAVGNVVMNRLSLPAYPDTVRGVIFDDRGAVQFTPAYSGAIHCSPDPECIIAAKLALDGADVIGKSLYFNNSRYGSWAARNKQLVATIGNHNFYA